MVDHKPFIDFWPWLFGNTPETRGWRQVVNLRLLIDLGCGIVLALCVAGSVVEPARTALIPLAGVFIGLSFAWTGSAQAVLDTPEVGLIATQKAGGLESYVWNYQLSILAILTALVAWGIAGLGVFDHPCIVLCSLPQYFAIKVLLFGLASLSLRECWSVIRQTQALFLAAKSVRSLEEKRRGEVTGPNLKVGPESHR